MRYSSAKMTSLKAKNAPGVELLADVVMSGSTIDLDLPMDCQFFMLQWVGARSATQGIMYAELTEGQYPQSTSDPTVTSSYITRISNFGFRSFSSGPTTSSQDAMRIATLPSDGSDSGLGRAYFFRYGYLANPGSSDKIVTSVSVSGGPGSAQNTSETHASSTTPNFVVMGLTLYVVTSGGSATTFTAGRLRLYGIRRNGDFANISAPYGYVPTNSLSYVTGYTYNPSFGNVSQVELDFPASPVTRTTESMFYRIFLFGKLTNVADNDLQLQFKLEDGSFSTSYTFGFLGSQTFTDDSVSKGDNDTDSSWQLLRRPLDDPWFAVVDVFANQNRVMFFAATGQHNNNNYMVMTRGGHGVVTSKMTQGFKIFPATGSTYFDQLEIAVIGMDPNLTPEGTI